MFWARRIPKTYQYHNEALHPTVSRQPATFFYLGLAKSSLPKVFRTIASAIQLVDHHILGRALAPLDSRHGFLQNWMFFGSKSMVLMYLKFGICPPPKRHSTMWIHRPFRDKNLSTWHVPSDWNFLAKLKVNPPRSPHKPKKNMYHLVIINIAGWKIPYKWRFKAGKIIYFYGPSIPWLCYSHNQRVYCKYIYI